MLNFKTTTQKEIDELNKALSTNEFGQANIDTATGGAAFIPQSLENTLKVLTYENHHLRLWNRVHKDKAYSTIEEFNVVDSYGEDLPTFMDEGLAGPDTTGNYERRFAKVKGLNTTRSVTNLMTLVTTTEDPVALETNSGILHLLGQTERALFYGDSSIGGDGREGAEWDGLFKQADETNVMDLRGKHFEDTHLNEAANIVQGNYGIATDVFLPLPVSKLFSEQYYPNQRALMNVESGELTAGTTITKFNSMAGTLDIQPSLFMNRGIKELNLTDKAMGVAPTTPTVTVATDETEGLFDAGTYKYAIVAFSKEGKSDVINVDPVTSIKGKSVKLTIKNAENQIVAPESFTIYRTENNGNKFYEIGRVGATSTEANGETVFIDKNENLPGTADLIVGQFSPDALALKELAPMFKLDYALTGPRHRFGIFYYATPTMYMPKRFVTVKNIKITE